jgi:dihydrofolate reductase
MKTKMIFACGTRQEFALSDNTMPWGHVKEDLRHFLKYTKDCVLIMGRKTWDSLPEHKLPGRICIVITSKPETLDTMPDFTESSLCVARLRARTKALEYGLDTCIIGGLSLFTKAAHFVDELSMSIIAERKMKPIDWTQNTVYIDMPSILTVAEDRGLIDYTSKHLDDVTITTLSRGTI